MLPLVFACVTQVSTAAQPIEVDGMLCHPSRLLVKLNDIENVAPVEGYRIVRTYPQIRYAVVEVQPGTLKVVRDKLRTRAGIERVDYDRAARPAYEPNDALWPDMWHARTIKAHLAWDVTFGSNNVVVAIMDTGVNHAHPDLAANMWTNPEEIAGNGIDDDGNGYIDDVYGADFAYNDGVPNDVHGHGTACAGLAAAIQDNTIGVTGVAPRAKIMGLKSATDEGWFYDSANIGAYLYAADKGADIISCSFFSDRVSQAEMDAVNYMYGQGVLPVVAAGNAASVYPYYPGGYDKVLCVAATDQNDARAGFSNFGTWVDVASPGVSLRTTTTGGDYTNGFGGTSGATPQVAGLAALIKGANPNLTNSQIRAIIEDTATDLSWDFSQYGLINCEQAVKVALGLAQQIGKSSVAKYMTPYVVANSAGLGGRRSVPTRIYGRGFEAPHVVQVKYLGKSLPLLSQTRNYVEFMMPAGSETISVVVDGTTIKNFFRFSAQNTAYTLIEASANNGGWVTGGFTETARADGSNMVCTQQSNGVIRLDGTFRKVQTIGAGMKLQIRRNYTTTSGGTEKIYLYNWTSASFPYGSYTLLSTLPAVIAPGTTSVSVPEPWRYVDEDGTMYFRIETTGTSANSTLNIDQALILQR